MSKEKPLEARFMPGSLAWRLAMLNTGDTIAEPRRMERKELKDYDRAAEHRRLESIVNVSIARVAAKQGKTFQTERCATVTAQGDVILLCVVTRTA